MARADFRFFFPFRVRYAEIDGQKIVFNGVYLTYYDTAITEYFRWLQYDYMGAVDREGIDYHTVRALVEYKAPIHFDAEIEVGVRVGRIGTSSLTFLLEIHPKDQESVYATGEVVWVAAPVGAHRSCPLPAGLVDLIRARDPQPA